MEEDDEESGTAFEVIEGDSLVFGDFFAAAEHSAPLIKRPALGRWGRFELICDTDNSTGDSRRGTVCGTIYAHESQTPGSIRENLRKAEGAGHEPLGGDDVRALRLRHYPRADLPDRELGGPADIRAIIEDSVAGGSEKILLNGPTCVFGPVRLVDEHFVPALYRAVRARQNFGGIREEQKSYRWGGGDRNVGGFAYFMPGEEYPTATLLQNHTLIYYTYNAPQKWTDCAIGTLSVGPALPEEESDDEEWEP